ncbi:MAG: DUF4474 domain-containing protein [Clostridia bacterium]|nr:DUF4474 domain-containing protein [Clostridia bacterium]
MKFFSAIMSVVMLAMSVFTPVSVAKTEGESVSTRMVSAQSEKAEFLSEEAKAVLSVVVENIVTEAKDGSKDSQEVLDAINSLHVYKEGEEKPERNGGEVNPLKKAIDKGLKDIVNKTLPEGMIRNFLNHLTSGMHDLYIYFVPCEEEEGVYYFCCDYVDNDGNVVEVFTGIRYNPETGKLYGKDNNGLMGIGFDYDAKNYTITTPVNVWMRDLGYSVFFDIIGGMGFMSTDTVRVKFEHGSKHWMFQFWKGNYGFKLLNGAELGIYNKENKNDFAYTCATDDEMLVMSTTLRTEDEILIEREEMRHWWMCGFRFGPGVSPNELIMESTIQFEDEEMMKKFIESAKEYSDEMTVSAEGLKVTVIW